MIAIPLLSLQSPLTCLFHADVFPAHIWRQLQLK